MRVVFVTIALLFVTAVVTAQTQDIVALAVATPSLSTLVTALKAANLVSALQGPGPFTVFAPNNDAFNALPPKYLQYLLANPDKLTQVLLYHVVSGKALSTDLTDNEVLPTLNVYNNLTVGIDDTGVYINPVRPHPAAKVIAADNLASNGVVHIVDTVLVPHILFNIVELAQNVPALSTLVKAVIAANLTAVLSTGGPFTVLAPTNDAFDALPAGVLANLLAHPDQLAKVLTYHVISGQVYSNQLTDGEVVPTVNGQSLTVAVNQDGVTFSGTGGSQGSVEKADVQASNGVVHVIDGVLIPNL